MPRSHKTPATAGDSFNETTGPYLWSTGLRMIPASTKRCRHSRGTRSGRSGLGRQLMRHGYGFALGSLAQARWGRGFGFGDRSQGKGLPAGSRSMRSVDPRRCTSYSSTSAVLIAHQYSDFVDWWWSPRPDLCAPRPSGAVVLLASEYRQYESIARLRIWPSDGVASVWPRVFVGYPNDH